MSTTDGESMTLEIALTDILESSSGDMMHLEIMVEDAIQAAIQQFNETQSKLRSSIYGEELYK